MYVRTMNASKHAMECPINSYYEVGTLQKFLPTACIRNLARYKNLFQVCSLFALQPVLLPMWRYDQPLKAWFL